jgi:hypothetical protein
MQSRHNIHRESCRDRLFGLREEFIYRFFYWPFRVYIMMFNKEALEVSKRGIYKKTWSHEKTSLARNSRDSPVLGEPIPLRASTIMGSKPAYMASLFMWKRETSKSRGSELSCKSQVLQGFKTKG